MNIQLKTHISAYVSCRICGRSFKILDNVTDLDRLKRCTEDLKDTRSYIVDHDNGMVICRNCAKSKPDESNTEKEVLKLPSDVSDGRLIEFNKK